MTNNKLDFPVLEEHCGSCDGQGWYWPEDRDSRRWCEVCNGAGFVPTEFGERVLELMRHNFKPMLENASNE
jgi:DnaJ-class molecular chaperone